MPDRWAVATGNWSNTATWNGGTLPQAGDDVFADGFTVTINQNVNVLSIRTTQRTGGTAGGGFTLGLGFNVTGNVISGTTTCLSISTASGTHTVTGNVTGGTQGGANGAINKSGNSSLVVVGNVTAGGSTLSVGLNITAGGSVVITGNCLGTGFQQAFGVRYVGGSSLTVNGNVTGGAGNGACGVQAGTSPMNVTITGTIDNGSGYQSNGLAIGGSTTGTVIINGNVVTTNGQPTVQLGELSANVAVTINGNVTATAGNAIASVSSGGSVAASNTATITVNGNVTSSGPLAAIVHLTNNGFVIVNGSIFSHTTGNVPVAAYRILLHPSTTMQHEYRVNNAGSPGVARSLYTGGVNLNQPAISNVRSGIVYGASNEFTGTCAVPGAASVVVGVPVDNTTGTATIDAASISSAIADEVATILSAIGNIEVDNAAIASAVRDNLGLTGSLDSAFADTNSNITDVGLAVVAVGTAVDGKPTLVEIEGSTILAKESNATSNKNEILTAVGNIEVDNTAIASAVRVELTDELEIINNIPDSFDFIAEQIDGIQTVFYVSPTAATAPKKVAGKTLKPYYKDTSTIGPIGIFDANKEEVDLSEFDGDMYVVVEDSDTDEVLMRDENPTYTGNSLYIDPSPESVGVLDAPLCWALRRISNNQVLMEGPWEVNNAAYGES